jgi:hypothetical protein
MHVGYVERFIFETAKISQLFCHQIIWNMNANTYVDDDVVSSSWPITMQESRRMYGSLLTRHSPMR